MTSLRLLFLSLSFALIGALLQWSYVKTGDIAPWWSILIPPLVIGGFAPSFRVAVVVTTLFGVAFWGIPSFILTAINPLLAQRLSDILGLGLASMFPLIITIYAALLSLSAGLTVFFAKQSVFRFLSPPEPEEESLPSDPEKD